MDISEYRFCNRLIIRYYRLILVIVGIASKSEEENVLITEMTFITQLSEAICLIKKTSLFSHKNKLE